MFTFLRNRFWPFFIILFLFACTSEAEAIPSPSFAKMTEQMTDDAQTPAIVQPLPTQTQLNRTPAVSSTITITTSTSVPTSPKPTVTSAPTYKPDATLMEGPVVAFKVIDRQTGKQEILFLDISTGVNRQIELPIVDGEVVNLDWAKNGCQLYVSIRTLTGMQFLTLDLLGEQSGNVQFTGFEGVYSDWTVAPTGEYIAYLAHSGFQDLYYSEFQDVLVISTADIEATPLALTSQSWTFRPVWSPDGKNLAYSSLDNNGIVQLFYSSPSDRDPVMLTNFLEEIERIEVIKWSPDSTRVAFAMIKEGQISLWSINADGSNLQEASLGDFIPLGEPWWTDDNQAYAVLAQQWFDDHPVSGSNTILWIDSLTGQITHELLLALSEETNSEIVFPAVTGDSIGFWGKQVVLYNPFSESSSTLTSSPLTESVQLALPFPVIAPGPANFSGESTCK